MGGRGRGGCGVGKMGKSDLVVGKMMSLMLCGCVRWWWLVCMVVVGWDMCG